jgi:uncharacterized delta-60 repeat protein
MRQITMKKNYIIIILSLLCILNIDAVSQVWVNSYNGPANGDDKSTAMKTDAAGNIYITGYSTGLGTSKDITTIKYNSQGVLQWTARYNGPANSIDEAYAITIDASGNIYVTGYSVGSNSDKDIVTIKYNSSGAQQWAIRHTSPGEYDDEAYAITVDAAGNSYVCGYQYDDDKDDEIVVIKYNSSGVMQWIRDYNGTSNEDRDEAYAITVDAAGNVYITGSSEGSSTNRDFVTIKYNSTGSQQWAQRYNNSTVNGNDEAYAITIDGSSNIYVTGYSLANSNGKDYVSIKYNSSGTLQWLSRYNNSSANDDDIARAIVLMNNDDIVVTGSSRSTSSSDKEDYLTIRYNSSDGSQVFAARYNDSSANSKDIAYAIDVTSSNSSIFVTGSSRQTVSSGSEDIVTIEYSPTGSVRKKSRIVNPGEDAAYAITIDSNNDDFYVSGYLSGSSSGYNMGSAKFSEQQVTSITHMENGIPSDFRLYQNYPNPFNPSTIIKFDVKDASMVKIAIYSILGKEISVPVNDFLRSGTYEVSTALNNLPSGMYFYKMTTNSYTESKTMMLIK